MGTDDRLRGAELGAYADSSSEAARARERMMEAQGRHGRPLSRRQRLVIGWTIALAIVGLLLAAFADWSGLISS